MSKRKTHEEYVAELEATGSGIVAIERYKNTHAKILHRCLEGHEWKSYPSHLLRGTGCPYCSKTRILSYEERLRSDGRGFVALETYSNSQTPTLHQCLKGHVWRAIPNNIIRGSGCPYCAGYFTAPYQDRLDADGRGFVALEQYKKCDVKILHRCLKGHKWKATPDSILRGNGCPHCSGLIPISYQLRLDIGNRGIIALEEYKGSMTKILHRCQKGHEWKTHPESVLSGSGCPSCAKTGFDPNKPAMLYYLRVAGGKAYKVGITNRSVKDRFKRKDFENIEIIKETHYEIGQDAYEAEQLILKKFAHCAYKGEPLLTTGNTEMFDYDVLGLDVMEEQFPRPRPQTSTRTQANSASAQSQGLAA